MTECNVTSRVSKILTQALNADPEDIKPTSKIVADLGAESIDFLDVTFRLEREFGLRIPQGELFPENVFQAEYDACMKDGKMTPYGINKLQNAAPHIALRDEAGRLTFDGTIPGLMDAFTVQSLVNYIHEKVKQ